MTTSYAPQPHPEFVYGLNKLTAKEKRRIDNEVNKINKRLIAAAKNGGMASESFTALASMVEMMEGRIVQEQMDVLGIKTKKGVNHVQGIVTPITYTIVKLDDGQTVYVPQIRRATWVLQAMKQSERNTMLEVTTAQAEATAVEKYLTAENKEVSAESIRKTLEDREATNDFYDFVWKWLYDYKHKYQEIQNFLDEITGKSNDGTNNSKAVKLYNKYSQLEQEPHDRPLTEKEMTLIKNRKQEAQIRYYQSQTDEQKRQAVSDYLTLSSVRGEYGDTSLTYDAPSEQEVNNQLEELAENNSSWR